MRFPTSGLAITNTGCGVSSQGQIHHFFNSTIFKNVFLCRFRFKNHIKCEWFDHISFKGGVISEVIFQFGPILIHLYEINNLNFLLPWSWKVDDSIFAHFFFEDGSKKPFHVFSSKFYSNFIQTKLEKNLNKIWIVKFSIYLDKVFFFRLTLSQFYPDFLEIF